MERATSIIGMIFLTSFNASRKVPTGWVLNQFLIYKRYSRPLIGNNWEYYELPDADEEIKVAMLEEVIRNSDFFWPVAGPANPEDWLIARKRGEQKRLSFCGCAELLEDIKDFKSKNCPRLDKMPKAMRVLWSIYSKVPAVFGKVINGRPDL